MSQQHLDDDDDDDVVDQSDELGRLIAADSGIEHTPLFSQPSRYYVLDTKIELGEMAGMFFNDFGRLLFYLCIAIYLYGDLSIYSAAVAQSVRDVLWYVFLFVYVAHLSSK